MERTTKRCENDGVEVFAIINRDGEEKQIVSAVYRYPFQKYVLETTAGLTDPGETDPRITALRELKEETGYAASLEDITNVSPLFTMSPWWSTETSYRVDVRVPDTEENRTPRQELDGEEQIQVFLLSRRRLLEEIMALAEEKGFMLDSRLYQYALGLKEGMEMARS